MNQDSVRIRRTVIDMLSLLGDIGGFIEAITFICSIILMVIQFDLLNRYMINQLYTIEWEDEEQSEPKRDQSSSE